MICPDCSAKGFVFEYKKLIILIPELVETGHVLKLKHPTKRRTIDVKFTVIKDHLRRDGLNLKSSTEISLSQAVFGCFITIKGLNEHNYVEIAAGTQSNTEITVIGKGIKNLANGEVGNHILTIKVKIPTKLTKEQRIILKQYADAERKSDAESFQKHNILL